MNNKAGEGIETDRVGLQFEMGRSQKDTMEWIFSKGLKEVSQKKHAIDVPGRGTARAGAPRQECAWHTQEQSGSQLAGME